MLLGKKSEGEESEAVRAGKAVGVINEHGKRCCLLVWRSLPQINFMVVLHVICEFLSFGFMRNSFHKGNNFTPYTDNVKIQFSHMCKLMWYLSAALYLKLFPQ